MAEEDIAVVCDEAREAMEKSIRSLRADLQKVRTGRANTALLDGIQIDYYGTPTPLNQLANLTTPDPRLIVISPYDKGVLQAIERAIQTSDLGFTPNNDGKVVRIPIPPLTRREAISMLKELESDGTLPADERRRGDKKMQDLTDEYVKKIDEMSTQKEKEVLQV
jgi:ribosome recycling factor